MSRNYYLLPATILASLVIMHHACADDYGERFYNQTPTGLAEYSVSSHETPDIAMDDAARELQNIMPAAGDEETTPISEEEAKKENTEEDPGK